jgi:hypothetical protein
MPATISTSPRDTPCPEPLGQTVVASPGVKHSGMAAGCHATTSSTTPMNAARRPAVIKMMLRNSRTRVYWSSATSYVVSSACFSVAR